MTPNPRDITVPDAPAETPAIDARGLSLRFGEVVAVDAVDLHLAPGAVFGLLGPDGAGKSTLIRLLASVLRPDAGDAEVFGHSVSTEPHLVTPRIGYMSQQFSMYPDLTVAENLEFFGTLRGVAPDDRRTRARELLRSMGMTEFAGRQAQYLSGGMKQKLMLAATLMHEPDLLLLDEPTTGVDPVSRREFWRIIASLHQRGKTVLVATPYMDEAERCTHVAFMDSGAIRTSGTPAQVKTLVPGTLYEILAPDPRAALASIAEKPGVISAHLYGEVVRAIAETGGPNAADLEATLAQAGVAVDRVREARVDMEAAFAYLAEFGDGAS